MRMATREQLWEDVVTAIANAMTDGRGGIDTQAELAAEVGCSTATLSAEMPHVVAKSRRMFPGHCIEVAQIVEDGVAPFYRYTLVDEQTAANKRMTRRRMAAAQTKARRAMHEVDVAGASPSGRAALQMMEAGSQLIAAGLAMLEEDAAV